MNNIGGIVGGIIGAIIGAAIWAAVSYFARLEVGWIAWGVGGLAGVGVRIGSRAEGGQPLGVLAVILALGGIALGKAAAIYLDMKAFSSGDEIVLSELAKHIVEERIESGQPVTFTQPRSPKAMSDFFPDWAWSEAQQRLATMSADEQVRVRQFPPSVYEHWLLVEIADEVVVERGKAGESFTWPAGINGMNDAWRKSHYPPEVWGDAEARWAGMSPSEQEAYRSQLFAARAAGFKALLDMGQQDSFGQAFVSSFSLFDIVFVILAVGTAYRLGATPGAAPSRRDPLDPNRPGLQL